MAEPRELRGLAIAEVLAVVAIALAPWPATVPVAIPLLVVASLARWLRFRSWGELFHGGGAAALLGAVAGVVGVGLAVMLGTPLVETTLDRAVEWSRHPIVRGSSSQLFAVALFVGVTSLALELAMRGWLVERVLELGAGRPGIRVLAVVVGALAEALVTPGNVAARIGAALFGAGLGAMYVAGGRSLVVPVCARVAFALAVLLLESLKLVG